MLKWEVLEPLRRQLRRLPRNIASNRWYVLTLGHIYFYAPKHAAEFARQVGVAEPKGRRSTVIRMYVRLTFRFPVQTCLPTEDVGFLFPHLGRLGNAIQEIVCAMAVAQDHKIGHLVIQGFSLFSSKGELANPGLVKTDTGTKIWIGHKFFLSKTQTSPRALVRWSRKGFPLSDNPKAWAATRMILPSIPRTQVWGRDTLVIHLRGGDVFGGRNATAYGQPPLAFYLWVLEQREWREVVIVHQDNKNPVLEPLAEAVRQRGAGLEMFSGRLADDINVLMGARTIVAGRGTFIPAIAGLSEEIREVFYFEDKFTLFPEKPGVRIIRVVDAGGQYTDNVLRNNWTNSPKQRALMVEYPSSQLKQG